MQIGDVGLFILSSSSKIPCITVLSLMSCMQKVFIAVEVISVKCRHRLCKRLSCSNKTFRFFQEIIWFETLSKMHLYQIDFLNFAPVEEKNNEFLYSR